MGLTLVGDRCLFYVVLLKSFMSTLLTRNIPSRFDCPMGPPPTPRTTDLTGYVGFPMSCGANIPQVRVPLFRLGNHRDDLPLMVDCRTKKFGTGRRDTCAKLN